LFAAKSQSILPEAAIGLTAKSPAVGGWGSSSYRVVFFTFKTH